MREEGEEAGPRLYGQGIVVCFSGEASRDVHEIADFVALELASKHLTYYRTTMTNAKSLYTHRIRRTWGHSFARNFSRVLLERIRDNLGAGPAPSRHHSDYDGGEADVNEEFAFFHPDNTVRGGASPAN